MATVTIQKRKKQNGTMSYPVYFVDPYTGKKKYHATYKTLKDAQLATHTLRDVIDKGSAPEVRRKARGLTLAEIAEMCKMTWREKHASGQISDATLRSYLGHLKALLIFERTEIMADGTRIIHPPLSNFKVALLTPDIVSNIRTSIAANISAVSSNRRLFALKELCKRALKEGEIAKNPTIGISNLSEKKHCRTNFLVPKQLDNLLECARKSVSPYLEAMILLGAEHGASLQEILSLKWSDIDFNFENTGYITFFRTKTQKRRTMRLMPRTRESLLIWKEKLQEERQRLCIKEKDIQDFVCCHANGKPMTTLKTSWTKVRKEAGLEDFHFHDLRHTFCSSIIMSGGDLKTAAELIGHSSITMTNRYTHLTQLAHHNMQEKLAAYYGQGYE